MTQKYPLCPYLGQRSDPTTALAYPSSANLCHHRKPAGWVDADYQAEYCLTSRYEACQEFTRDPKAPIPMAPMAARGTKPSRRRLGVWIPALLLVALAALAGWWLLNQPVDVENRTAIPSAEPSASGTTFALTDTPLPMDTITLLPTETIPAASLPSHHLETPLGPDRRFIIHQITAGESLELIARQNRTTVESLQQCNFRLPSPLLPGWAIVVPHDSVCGDETPPFEVYSVTEAISAQDLAALLSAGLDEFLYYNVLKSDTLLQEGDWVLVPRVRTPTP